MSKFPVIESPCPFRAAEMPLPGKDHCGHCDRQVHNLDGMSRVQREAFMRGCAGQKVCVAYSVHRAAPRRNLGLGITLLASLAGSQLATAQEAPQTPSVEQDEASQPINAIDLSKVESTTILTNEQISKIPVASDLLVLVGGILDAGQARWADESDLTPSKLETLPEIDTLEWLPSKKTP